MKSIATILHPIQPVIHLYYQNCQDRYEFYRIRDRIMANNIDMIKNSNINQFRDDHEY